MEPLFKKQDIGIFVFAEPYDEFISFPMTVDFSNLDFTFDSDSITDDESDKFIATPKVKSKPKYEPKVYAVPLIPEIRWSQRFQYYGDVVFRFNPGSIRFGHICHWVDRHERIRNDAKEMVVGHYRKTR